MSLPSFTLSLSSLIFLNLIHFCSFSIPTLCFHLPCYLVFFFSYLFLSLPNTLFFLLVPFQFCITLHPLLPPCILSILLNFPFSYHIPSTFPFPFVPFSFCLTNGPNSALFSGHVTLITGWTLRDKCLDNVFCFSGVWVRPGLPMTVN